jgi:NADPH:quinone reductase
MNKLDRTRKHSLMQRCPCADVGSTNNDAEYVTGASSRIELAYCCGWKPPRQVQPENQVCLAQVSQKTRRSVKIAQREVPQRVRRVDHNAEMERNMHAVLIDEDQALTWSEVPDPIPNTGEILIDVYAAALNRADLLQRAGKYPPPQGWPEWMGLEVAGVVVEAPADSRWSVGDKVCALLGGGGYAEQVVVPVDMAMRVPEDLSMVEAAAIPEAFATSYLNLCIEGGLKAGDTVLIQAGASGLGMAAIQLAKALGVKVMTTVSTGEKAEFVRGLGADIVVNRTIDDLGIAMDEHPVDVTLDCISGPEMGRYIEKMAVGGRWIVIATLGGAMSEINMNTFFRRGIKLIGSTLRSRPPEMKTEILAVLERTLWQSFSSGAIKPVIYKTLPITQAEAAHAIIQRRENLGKVVLTVGKDTQ